MSPIVNFNKDKGALLPGGCNSNSPAPCARDSWERDYCAEVRIIASYRCYRATVLYDGWWTVRSSAYWKKPCVCFKIGRYAVMSLVTSNIRATIKGIVKLVMV